MSAFSDMIAKDSFPMYALFIDLDPSRLDINVHPTKQEIKFEDEKIIYAFVQAAVKHALAQFSITPTLDFDLDVSIQQTDAVSNPFTEEKQSAATSSSLYSTFTKKHQAHFIESKSDLKDWRGQTSDGGQQSSFISHPPSDISQADIEKEIAGDTFKNLFPVQESRKPSLDDLAQLHCCYIVAQNAKGFIVINQQNAHERILYERFAEAIKGRPIATQRSLFPATIELAAGDAVLLNELLDDLHLLGFLVEPFGNNTFVIQGTPADVIQGNEKLTLEKMLDQYKHFSNDFKFSKREKLLRSMAWQQCIKSGTDLGQKEMKTLVDDLFNCETPNITPTGRPTFLEFKKEELDKMFGR